MYHYFTVSPKEVKELKAELRTGGVRHGTYECFSGFCGDFYDPIALKGKKLYYGVPLGKGGLDLIKDFNTRFKNIQIIVDFKKKISTFPKIDSLYAVTRYLLPRLDLKKVYYVIFHINFSAAYERSTRYHMTVPIMQFIRNYSPQSRYDVFWKTVAKDKDLATVSGLLTRWMANPHLWSQYGKWCELPVGLVSFMRLDNPETMNRICGPLDGEEELELYLFYGTQLFKRMFKIFPDDCPTSPDELDDIYEEVGEDEEEEAEDEWDWADEDDEEV